MLPLVVLHTEVQAGLQEFVSLRRYSAWTGLWLCKTWMASSTLNHCLFLPVQTERTQESWFPQIVGKMFNVVIVASAAFVGHRSEGQAVLNTLRPQILPVQGFSAVEILNSSHWDFKCRLIQMAKTRSYVTILLLYQKKPYLTDNQDGTATPDILLWRGFSSVTIYPSCVCVWHCSMGK